MTDKRLTKAQTIKALIKLGVYDIKPHGKFQIEARIPNIPYYEHNVGLFDPRDLLAELQGRQSTQEQ